MRYAKAFAAAFGIVVIGGLVMRHVPDGWPMHVATVLTFGAAALAARRILRV